jgi:hypothetical protein
MDTSIINLKGVEMLSEKEKQLTNRLLNEYYKRIKRQLKNFTSIEAHIKEYEKPGKDKKARKFSFHVKAIAPTQIFEGDASDWDFARTLHKGLNKLMNRIEGALHSSDQHSKERRPQKRTARKN